MSAFTGEGMMTESIPVESGNAEACFRGDHGPVAVCIFGAFAERDEILRIERVDAVRIGLKIVEQADRCELELLR